MRTRMALGAVVALPWLGTAALAQQAPPDDRMERFEQRLNELERKHHAGLKARDEEISRLRTELERVQRGRPTTAPTADPAAPDTRTDEIEKTKQDVLDDINSRQAPPLTLRRPASFNPDIALITDFVGSLSATDDRPNDAYNRFDVREVELDLRAAVHPRADGVVIFAFERDVENPIFAEEGGEEEGGGPESLVNVEEAYLFLHDVGVPNLTAKVGRFHVRFGRQNLLHLHDLPTTDPPFVNQAFLSPEALTDAGVSLSYVIPSRFVAGQYVEVIGEVITGEGAGSESPTLAGDLSVDSPAVNTHLLWNRDMGREWNLELGGSWLTGHGDADNRRDVNLFGADVTLLRTDPTGGFRNSLIQAEAIYGIVDQEDGSSEEAFGLYLLGQQQLKRDWYAGLRLDWTQNPNDADQEAWGVTPYVSWYWTESLRFRVSYQHRDGDREAEDVVFLQATWLFGSHPGHPYWSMR